MVEAADFRHFWTLDSKIRYLNHGSYGACPRPILEIQSELQAQLEREPVRFFSRELEPLAEKAQRALAAFAGAKADDLVFVRNATAGANTVLRSISFSPGDELLVTNHAYNACRNALAYVAERSGAQIVVAEVPFPIASESEIAGAIVRAVTPRTRLALIDHVTSPTAILFPIEAIVRELTTRGVDVLVDGAHAPGMIPLDLERLGAAYYTGNCHKWLCAPKGAAFLWVRPDKQSQIVPLSVSHGHNSERRDRSRFQIEFDWSGTEDPTAFLVVPDAIEFLRAQLGTMEALYARNHALTCAARQILCAALEVPPPCPDAMLGSMASIPIDGSGVGRERIDPLQQSLYERGFELPIMPWSSPWTNSSPARGGRLLRVSAQLYNSLSDYEALAQALEDLN